MKNKKNKNTWFNDESYHPALSYLDKIPQYASKHVVLIRNPLTNLPGPRKGWRKKISQARIFLKHIGLCRKIWKNKKAEIILIREFSNLPMLVATPLIYPLRKKVHLVVHHNLQWTLQSRAQKWAFSTLLKQGFNMVIYETTQIDALEPYRPLPGKCVSWSLNAPPIKPIDHTKEHKHPVIGFVGHYRKEKGIATSIDCLNELHHKGTPSFDVLIGLPNWDEVREDLSSLPPEWEKVDTSTTKKYVEALQKIDLLILSYPASSYAYRVSGVIIDAALHHTAVLVPDLPLLSHQISTPTPIGFSYTSSEDLIDKVVDFCNHYGSYHFDFEAYVKGRNIPAIARQVDDWY